MYPKPKPLTPNTGLFQRYLRDSVTPLLRAHLSRTQVSVMCDLLTYLEQQRYDFSAERAYQTRPLSNAQIAAAFDVTVRTVRRWFALLEDLGILIRELRKNPHHAFKNLRNRLRFCGFKDWFQRQRAKAPAPRCPPKEKDIHDIPLAEKTDGAGPVTPPPFPAPNSIRYSPFWLGIAKKHLPSGRGRPCIVMLAAKFRENLARHGVDPTHRSVPKRWENFCKRAKSV